MRKTIINLSLTAVTLLTPAYMILPTQDFSDFEKLLKIDLSRTNMRERLSNYSSACFRRGHLVWVARDYQPIAEVMREDMEYIGKSGISKQVPETILCYVKYPVPDRGGFFDKRNNVAVVLRTDYRTSSSEVISLYKEQSRVSTAVHELYHALWDKRAPENKIDQYKPITQAALNMADEALAFSSGLPVAAAYNNFDTLNGAGYVGEVSIGDDIAKLVKGKNLPEKIREAYFVLCMIDLLTSKDPTSSTYTLYTEPFIKTVKQYLPNNASPEQLMEKLTEVINENTGKTIPQELREGINYQTEINLRPAVSEMLVRLVAECTLSEGANFDDEKPAFAVQEAIRKILSGEKPDTTGLPPGIRPFILETEQAMEGWTGQPLANPGDVLRPIPNNIPLSKQVNQVNQAKQVNPNP